MPEEDRRRLGTAFLAAIGFEPEHAVMTWDGYHGQIEEEIKVLSRGSAVIPSLYLHGPVGTGKTGLLAAIARERFCFLSDRMGVLAHQSVSFHAPRWRYARHRDINRAMHDYDDENELSVSETWDFTLDVPYLLIDDLGSEPDDRLGYHLARLEELIDHRKNLNLTTWITSNLSGKALRAMPQWGRIVSRMSDQSWLIAYEITGIDRRGLNVQRAK